MKKLSCILCFTLLFLSACSSQSSRIAVEQDFDQLKAAKTRVSLGLTYLKNGNFSQAKYNLDKALQFAPRSADAHFALAYYYQQVEEHDAADKAYQTAMDLEPRNADIANSYGAFLCQRGEYAEAKRYFLKAVNSDNYISSAETYENLALCSQTHGQFEDALQYLRSAVNHQPGRSKSLYLLAQLLTKSNHWVEAKDVLRRYEKVSQVSAGSLLLASEIERALGNFQLSKGYGDMLLSMYPSDPATARYLQQSRTPSTTVTPIARKSNKKAMVEPLVVVETSGQENIVLQQPKAISLKKPAIEASDTPAEVVISEPVADIPTEVVISEPVADIPTEVVISEPVADIPTEVVISEPVADIPAEVSVSVPLADMQGEEKEASPDETVDQSVLASQDAVTEVIESSLNKDVITHRAEKNQEIEHAGKIVVEKGEPQTEQSPTFHIVQKQENLYRISLLYNIKIQRLIEWNNLPDGAPIDIGKKLIIVAPENQE
ncbi:MAG: type IV pilus assembly protein PilF [Paraglaciecola sp.]|jgi:type IV pilus assembly protein PilF